MVKTYFHIRTFGCQMNVADSAAFSAALENAGYAPAENPSDANLIIVNTCTVRQHAEERALSEIGYLKKWKNKDPKNRTLIVAGCVASRLGDTLKKRFPQVDLTIGAEEVEAFPEILRRVGQKLRHEIASAAPRNDTGKIAAFVPVMRGCNNFCSYCIVPYVRGREKSRAPREIVNEIKRLADTGVKEVTLLGQNVNSYRYEIASATPRNDTPETDFADLLAMVNNVSGIRRIRFMTSHPRDLSDKIINALASLDKMCPHVHLPLQSGSDRILKLMNRGYTRAHYIKLIQKIRKKIPGVSVTTDLLVGFPSETEKDFEDTVDAVKKCGFDFAYVFKYSPREKTAASKMSGAIAQNIIKNRHAGLLKLCNQVAEKSNKKLLGKTVEVLVESVTETGELWVKSVDNRAVYVNAGDSPQKRGQSPLLIGTLINAKIIGAKIHSLSGIITEKCQQNPAKKKTH
jgi:tRNA-2-methylthio-N6-dimethylallyladenosine synthase